MKPSHISILNLKGGDAQVHGCHLFNSFLRCGYEVNMLLLLAAQNYSNYFQPIGWKENQPTC